jgi:hypothetical protein
MMPFFLDATFPTLIDWPRVVPAETEWKVVEIGCNTAAVTTQLSDQVRISGTFLFVDRLDGQVS